MAKKSFGETCEELSAQVASRTGSTTAFAVAVGVVVVWGLTGPLFNYSNTWQLVINTGTTIVTFLMVFLIQRSQNKDSLAMHLKLNELVAAMKGASNRLIDVETLSERELARSSNATTRGARQLAKRREAITAVALDRRSTRPAFREDRPAPTPVACDIE